MSTTKYEKTEEHVFYEVTPSDGENGDVTRTGQFEVRESRDGQAYYVLKHGDGKNVVLSPRSSRPDGDGNTTGSKASGASANPAVLKVGKAGNSLMVRITRPVSDELGLAEGDELFATVGPDGSLHLSPYDPEFQRKLKAYRRVARKNRNALAELAK